MTIRLSLHGIELDERLVETLPPSDMSFAQIMEHLNDGDIVLDYEVCKHFGYNATVTMSYCLGAKEPLYDVLVIANDCTVEQAVQKAFAIANYLHERF